MGFSKDVREEALILSRRCCCVCQEFSGKYVQVHHIIQEADGGSNDLDNAIVLCLRCHGEAGHYNPRHPIGNKYSPEELRKSRDNWWKWCKSNPGKPLPSDPIAITPDQLDIGNSEWKSKGIFKVHNKTDHVLFNVFIKLTFDVNINFNFISISPTKLKEELNSMAGPIQIINDILRIDGLDKDGNKAIFLRLLNIDPSETLTFILQKDTEQNKRNKVIKANVFLIDYEYEPASVLEKYNESAISLKFPEDFQVKTIHPILRKTN